MASLYERLGGAKAVNTAVDIFYRKVLADDRIRHFFDSIDMDRQRDKQKSFLTMAFGGPNRYTGRGLRNAHKRLVENGMNDMHFDAVVELLGQTLSEMGAAEADIRDAAGIAESVREDVLGRRAASA